MPDPLGSTVALLDNTQTQTDTFSYWPYGEVNTRTGTTPTPFQFVGTLGYYQSSPGKAYVRARYLDSQKGRWLTEDPIGLGGGDWNLYRYVNNSPVVLTDPSGQICGVAEPGDPDKRPPQPTCPNPNATACWVTCYHKSPDGNYWTNHGKGCQKKTRPVGNGYPGDCSTYCDPYGRKPSFPPGSIIHIDPLPGKKRTFPNTKCKICDCGSYTDPPMDKKQWPNRPKCWIDVFVSPKPKGQKQDCEPG